MINNINNKKKKNLFTPPFRKYYHKYTLEKMSNKIYKVKKMWYNITVLSEGSKKAKSLEN